MTNTHFSKERKVKPVLYQYFYFIIKTQQKKMYKCKQSSVKLDYACKSQNDILIIFFYRFYPEVTFLFKDELSALCHSSN